MAVVNYGSWSMPVSREVEADPNERAKIIAVLKEIDRVFTIEKTCEPTLTSA